MMFGGNGLVTWAEQYVPSGIAAVLITTVPLAAGRRVRLRYATQIKTRPPTFAIWTSRPKELPESYTRYLVNGLREDFNLEGVPLRIHLRKGKNPYEGRAKKRR